jgi:large subunit ribosomal protein L18
MIDRSTKKNRARMGRKRRVRARVKGTAGRPRLSVYRSLRYTYAQLIDDATGKTVAAASDQEIGKKELTKIMKGDDKRKAKTAVAYAVGALLAEKAKKAGIETVVFDRGGFAYTGRVAALADGARDGGLKF